MIKLIEKSLIFGCLISLLSSQQMRLSNSQLDMLKEQIQQNPSVVDSVPDNINSGPILEEVAVESFNSQNEESLNFGYEYFNKDMNFYDNIPIPSEFRLGPGDEIILSMWGETNSRENFVINRQGSIFYNNIGFINLNDKTIEQAELILKDRLSSIFSTINSDENSTQLMVEIGKLKSINVYISGETKSPGINLIHPFSDIFTILNQVGIKETGSLRNIELIREGNIVAKFDFYSFFMIGNNDFSNVRVLDGDIVHIPLVKNRVEVRGEVKRQKNYELLDSESLEDLINFAGGVTEFASSKVVVRDIVPIPERLSDDTAQYGNLVFLSNASKVKLNNGASVNLLPLATNDFSVRIYGRVNLPGTYPAYTTILNDGKLVKRISSLKDVLDLAGGFDDPIFRKSINPEISILRLDESNFYGKEINLNYEDSENFNLEINDQIFVYESPNYYNEFTYVIKGEIDKPGTYPLRKGLTLQEAIESAGGLTELGSINSISVAKELSRINEDGMETNETELVSNINLNFEITNKNIITILPKTNVVRVEGNVYNPGLIAHSGSNNLSMARAIELAGGFKPYSLKKRSYVIRANGEIERANLFRGRAKRVYPGDSIVVPLNPDPQDFDISLFISELSTTLANIAAILILVDNNSN